MKKIFAVLITAAAFVFTSCGIYEYDLRLWNDCPGNVTIIDVPGKSSVPLPCIIYPDMARNVHNDAVESDSQFTVEYKGIRYTFNLGSDFAGGGTITFTESAGELSASARAKDFKKAE